MVETTSEIAAHIQATRDNLRSNLDELGDKVRSVTDWQQHYRNSPWMMMAVAGGAGLLLSVILGDRARGALGRGVSAPELQDLASRPTGEKGVRRNYFGELTGALIGVAASHAKSVINKLVLKFI